MLSSQLDFSPMYSQEALMKVLLISLAMFSSTCVASNHDTLQVNTQYSNTLYTGSISDLDTEDSIKQVEINDATVVVVNNGDIFANGFELYNVNWIWVGDDTSDHEFGGVGQCTETNTTDHDGAQHVILHCHELHNEVNGAITPNL